MADRSNKRLHNEHFPDEARPRQPGESLYQAAMRRTRANAQARAARQAGHVTPQRETYVEQQNRIASQQRVIDADAAMATAMRFVAKGLDAGVAPAHVRAEALARGVPAAIVDQVINLVHETRERVASQDAERHAGVKSKQLHLITLENPWHAR